MLTLLHNRLQPKLAQLKQAVRGRQDPMWKAAHDLVPVFDSMWLAFLQDSSYWKDKWSTEYSCLSMFEDPQIQLWWPEWTARVLDVDHKAQQVYHAIASTQDSSDLLRDAMSACCFGRHLGWEPETCASRYSCWNVLTTWGMVCLPAWHLHPYQVHLRPKRHQHQRHQHRQQLVRRISPRCALRNHVSILIC